MGEDKIRSLDFSVSAKNSGYTLNPENIGDVLTDFSKIFNIILHRENEKLSLLYKNYVNGVESMMISQFEKFDLVFIEVNTKMWQSFYQSVTHTDRLSKSNTLHLIRFLSSIVESKYNQLVERLKWQLKFKLSTMDTKVELLRVRMQSMPKRFGRLNKLKLENIILDFDEISEFCTPKPLYTEYPLALANDDLNLESICENLNYRPKRNLSKVSPLSNVILLRSFQIGGWTK